MPEGPDDFVASPQVAHNINFDDIVVAIAAVQGTGLKWVKSWRFVDRYQQYLNKIQNEPIPVWGTYTLLSFDDFVIAFPPETSTTTSMPLNLY